MILRSIQTTKLGDLIEYSRDLERFQTSIGIPANNNLERFCIGFYQINGGILWKSTSCEWESWASAAIHFLVVMEGLDLRVEDYLPVDIKDMVRILPNYKDILVQAAHATQMLFYAKQKGATQRSKRYDKGKLERSLGLLIANCIMAIPSDLRAEAIYNATEILSSRL